MCVNRTCQRINVYLFGDFVLLAPSGYCQSVLKQPRVPLQTKGGTTVILAALAQTISITGLSVLESIRTTLT